MSAKSLAGRCLCGAVAFTAENVESHIHACHCGICRRWSGGPAMAAAAGGLAFEDPAAVGVYASSAWAERGFCKTCGTNLFYRLRESGMTMVWTGTFDDASHFELAGEIFVDDKPAFYELAGDHPRQTGAEFMASVGMAPGE